MVPAVIVILGFSSIASSQQPWPVNGYGMPQPQPYMAPRMPANYGNVYTPTQGPPRYYFTPPSPATTLQDPNAGGWDLNYTPIDPLTPRRPANSLPTYSSAPIRAKNPALTPSPAWLAPTPESEQSPHDPDADFARRPAESHRPTRECFWISGDYLSMSIRSIRLPVLVTTGPLTDPIPGLAGQPNTRVLFGGNELDFSRLTGFRLNVGFFLLNYSFEAGGFHTGPTTERFRFASDANGVPNFGRPFFVAADGINREGILFNAFPGLFSGSVAIDARSQMSGIELNARVHKYGYVWDRSHMDALVGFRYLRLSESLEFRDAIVPILRSQVTFLGNIVNSPNSVQDQDSFRTANNFFGPQIGARIGWEEKWLTADAFAKIALGVTQQRVNINGSTTLVTPTGNQTAVGGVLAQQSNIGEHHRTVFDIVPELGANIGVNVTECIRIKLGYSFLLWNNVARPASQIDRNINPGQVPGAAIFGLTTGAPAPLFRFNDEVFWSHSLNAGVEVHY